MAKSHAGKVNKVDRDFVKKGAGGISNQDLGRVVDRGDEIKQQFSKGGPLGRFVNDVQLLVAIVQDYVRGDYREIPWLSVASIAFALLYVLNPLDLIPDVIPVVGQLDDAAVVGLCLVMVEQDLHNYRDWKVKRAA